MSIPKTQMTYNLTQYQEHDMNEATHSWNRAIVKSFLYGMHQLGLLKKKKLGKIVAENWHQTKNKCVFFFLEKKK